MENTYLDLFSFQARWNASKEAIYDCDADKRYTFQELDQRAERLARFLVGRLGLKKGDCVAFCARNAMAYFDMFFAARKTGIIITTYNYMLKPAELAGLMDSEQPKVLFYDAMLEDRLNLWTTLPYLKALVVLHGRSARREVLEYDEVVGSVGPSYEPMSIDPEDILMYLHTGGTTGVPKAAKMSYRAILSNCIGEVISFGLSYLDVGYQFLPLFHTGGWNVITLPLLVCGGRIVLKRDLDPGEILHLMEQERVTVGVSVPTIYTALSEHPNFRKTDFSSVRWLITGAAPVREHILVRYLDQGVKLCNSYGMTEVGPNNISLPVDFTSVDELKKHWNSVGKPMLLNDVKIVDEQGEFVPPGGCGELCFRGPLIFSGYLGQDAETRDTVRDGWVHTGDLAKEEDGYLYVVGRQKNMIISGGENLFPVEIESCISHLEGVKEVCVYGVPDDKWGEVPHALIVADDPPVTRETLERYLKEHLSGIKRPKVVRFVDSIPRGSVGKVDYRAIHQLYHHDEEE